MDTDDAQPTSTPPALSSSERIVLLARHRTIYDVALAFYAVLTALALDVPLKAFTGSLAASLAGRGLDDWTTRLLTITVLLQAAVWLHALMVTVELRDTRGERPGASGGQSAYLRLYRGSVVAYLSGVVMVVIIGALGMAVARGTRSFLEVSVLYIIWGGLFSLIHLMMSKTSLGTIWTLVSRGSDPDPDAGEDHAQPIAGDSMRQSVLLLVVSAGLIFWACNAPGHGLQPFLLAVIWLVIVAVAVVRDYRCWSYYGT